MKIEWDVPIRMDDGLVLRADIFRPEQEGRYPAILSYGPYGKGLAFQDGYKTAWEIMARENPDALAGSSNQYQNWEVVDPEKWVSDGYAVVRVDSRGAGRSPGYLCHNNARETRDICECVEWTAAQPWCSGAVGMIGISWGGFNGLQIAARRPPALKAVISLCSTDDRYADDVHYMGGCLLAADALPWAATMLALNAQPPDPNVLGDGWRAAWLHRMERTPPYIEAWLAHQRRDGRLERGRRNRRGEGSGAPGHGGEF